FGNPQRVSYSADWYKRTLTQNVAGRHRLVKNREIVLSDVPNPEHGTFVRRRRSPGTPTINTPLTGPLSTATAERSRRRLRHSLPDCSVVELDGHTIRGINRAEIGSGDRRPG